MSRVRKSWRGLCPQPNRIAVAASCRESLWHCGQIRSYSVSAQRASSSHSRAQRARKIAPKRPLRPNGPTVRSSARRTVGPLGLKMCFLFVDLAFRARLLEPMARWAGNAFEAWSEFFSRKQHTQHLRSRDFTWRGLRPQPNLLCRTNGFGGVSGASRRSGSPT